MWEQNTAKHLHTVKIVLCVHGMLKMVQSGWKMLLSRLNFISSCWCIDIRKCMVLHVDAFYVPEHFSIFIQTPAILIFVVLWCKSTKLAPALFGSMWIWIYYFNHILSIRWRKKKTLLYGPDRPIFPICKILFF